MLSGVLQGMGVCWESWVGGVRAARMILQDGFLGWVLGWEVEDSRWFLGLGVGVVAWVENGNGLC